MRGKSMNWKKMFHHIKLLVVWYFWELFFFLWTFRQSKINNTYALLLTGQRALHGCTCNVAPVETELDFNWILLLVLHSHARSWVIWARIGILSRWCLRGLHMAKNSFGRHKSYLPNVQKNLHRHKCNATNNSQGPAQQALLIANSCMIQITQEMVIILCTSIYLFLTTHPNIPHSKNKLSET